MRRIAERWTAVSSVIVGAVVLAVALYSRVGEAQGLQKESVSAPRIDFDKQIKPILEANCLECHSADKRKGGLSLAAYTDVLDGGRSGAVVRPGHAANSLLLARVKGEGVDQMPLDGLPLSDVEIAMLGQWVEQGARLTPSSPPAPAPWEAPLALTAPAVPAAVWPRWDKPADRLVAAYLSKARVPEPRLIPDALFARRAYLDIWGLLPSREQLQAFVADPAPDKRDRLVTALLADNMKYAEHWISFWNDLLRNDDGLSYFSDAEGGGRQSITPYLLSALTNNTLLQRDPHPAAEPDRAG